uniref:Response regulator n=1 Tax=Schlesneria paludicola TaxID=360056 RepID=A0A7C2K3H3_9PLAN
MRRNYQLLLADDDEAFREAVRAVCEPYFSIIEAATGGEALDVARRMSLDLALCDMHMPELSGLDVIEAFKRENKLRPGILMTARCSAKLRDQARRLCVDSVLEKPFTRQQLLDTMASVVESAFDDSDFGRQLRPTWH